MMLDVRGEHQQRFARPVRIVERRAGRVHGSTELAVQFEPEPRTELQLTFGGDAAHRDNMLFADLQCVRGRGGDIDAPAQPIVARE